MDINFQVPIKYRKPPIKEQERAFLLYFEYKWDPIILTLQNDQIFIDDMKTKYSRAIIHFDMIQKISRINLIENRYSLSIINGQDNTTYVIGFSDSTTSMKWKALLKKEYQRVKYSRMNVIKFGNQLMSKLKLIQDYTDNIKELEVNCEEKLLQQI